MSPDKSLKCFWLHTQVVFLFISFINNLTYNFVLPEQKEVTDIGKLAALPSAYVALAPQAHEYGIACALLPKDVCIITITSHFQHIMFPKFNTQQNMNLVLPAIWDHLFCAIICAENLHRIFLSLQLFIYL
jgi:hypothetical protein